MTIERIHQYHAKQKMPTVTNTTVNLNVRQKRLADSHSFVGCIAGTGFQLRKARSLVRLKWMSSTVPRTLSTFVDADVVADAVKLSMRFRGYRVSGRKNSSSSRSRPNKMEVSQLTQSGLAWSKNPPTVSH